ncbi:hypothetical protein N9L68_03525 [bacterium]|nr:hypothetical protein [bacterium]
MVAPLVVSQRQSAGVPPAPSGAVPLRERTLRRGEGYLGKLDPSIVVATDCCVGKSASVAGSVKFVGVGERIPRPPLGRFVAASGGWVTLRARCLGDPASAPGINDVRRPLVFRWWVFFF